MTFDDARHLVGRTAFGSPPAEIEALQKLSRKDAIDRVLKTTAAATTLLPDWSGKAPPSRRKVEGMMSDPRAFQEFLNQHATDLKGWWLNEMLVTDQPLTERMTLLWHGHFTSSVQKVRQPWSMIRQNQLLRKDSLGDFKRLLHGIVRDPAILYYLDNHRNSSREPNENLAREFFELFTLGEGNYTEKDIKEAARALTGYGLDRRTSTFRFRKSHHDRGEKTILGKTGRFDADDLVSLVLEHPACAPFITETVWKHFVTTPIPSSVRVRISKRFSSSWSITDLVRDVLSSEAFWAKDNRGTLIRGPVELVIGTVRTLGLKLDDPQPLIAATRQLGQDVFSPPNVKGWPGGDRWIDANSLLKRHVLLRRSVNAKSELTADPVAWMKGLLDAETPVVRLQRILLPVDPVVASPKELSRSALEEILLDPAYQLA